MLKNQFKQAGIRDRVQVEALRRFLFFYAKFTQISSCEQE